MAEVNDILDKLEDLVNVTGDWEREGLYAQAADEIERLREEILRFQGAGAYKVGYVDGFEAGMLEKEVGDGEGHGPVR